MQLLWALLSHVGDQYSGRTRGQEWDWVGEEAGVQYGAKKKKTREKERKIERENRKKERKKERERKERKKRERKKRKERE